ncbi:hypothetical protein AB1Y20_002399 [Prymnesium parvum]|uniref:CPW-WPC domain-containing protein n=1 Tax=Prymnesium parvum TaxID=97485 RepID=A0AB34J7V0_PRYPA
MQRLDLFPKTHSELSQRTLCGAAISLCCGTFIVWAAAHEVARCVAVETHARLLPHTSAEAARHLPINMDIHFPALPCSEIVLELTETTGKGQAHEAALPLADLESTLSKLRTGADGAPLGLPSRLDFSEKVALGLRLHQLMHLFGGVAAQLVRFSRTAGCVRDYAAHCPDQWTHRGGGRCEAPFWYFGQCHRLSSFLQYTEEMKADWSERCEANWPCRAGGEAASGGAEAEEGEDGGEEPYGGAAINASEVVRQTRRLDQALEALEVGELAGGDAGFGLVDAGLRALGVAARDGQAAWQAAAEREVAALEEEVRALRHAADGMHAAHSAGERADGAPLAEWRARLAAARRRVAHVGEVVLGSVSLEGVLRLRGYVELERNLTSVAELMDDLGGHPEQHTRLSDALRTIRGMVGELALGATGSQRREIERQLDKDLLSLLKVLRTMREGVKGEGCTLSGSVQLPRVPATLRFVPARHDKERAAVLPELRARHALYFNASHHVRHLSFGAYFPGQHNPLDSTSRVFLNGSSEMRYLIQVVPSEFVALNGSVVKSNLFSVTEHARTLHWETQGFALPGVFLSYDMSSLKVELDERRGASVRQSIARICALVGGVYTVGGILDKLVYHSLLHVGKQRVGKLS